MLQKLPVLYTRARIPSTAVPSEVVRVHMEVVVAVTYH